MCAYDQIPSKVAAALRPTAQAVHIDAVRLSSPPFLMASAIEPVHITLPITGLMVIGAGLSLFTGSDLLGTIDTNTKRRQTRRRQP